VEPVITSFVDPAPISDKADEGETITLSLDFTDPGTLDVHTFTVDWGDGNGEVRVLPVGDRSLTADHSYTTGGIFTITVTLVDDDTGSDGFNTTAFVTGVGVLGGELQIVGTSEDDQITVNRQGNGLIRVHASFIPEPGGRTFNAADVNYLVAVLCEGDDHINIAGNITLSSLIDAGGGNDHVNGGGGSDIILGRDGDDHLNGGRGRDILIGGAGRDRLVGGPGEDLLIGGIFSASFDGGGEPLESFVDDQPALLDIQNIWNDSSSSIQDRKTDIEASDEFFSKLVDDGDSDKLAGGSDADWFLLFDGDRATDLKTKKGDLVSSDP
jgi:Ca2+-binding RTX toxin-like protein